MLTDVSSVLELLHQLHRAVLMCIVPLGRDQIQRSRPLPLSLVAVWPWMQNPWDFSDPANVLRSQIWIQLRNRPRSETDGDKICFINKVIAYIDNSKEFIKKFRINLYIWRACRIQEQNTNININSISLYRQQNN